MLQVIFSIFYFREFFLRAKSGGENPWKWSALGGLGFIAATLILPIFFTVIVSLLLVMPADNIFLSIACNFASLIIGVLAANQFLNKKFPKDESIKETKDLEDASQE